MHLPIFLTLTAILSLTTALPQAAPPPPRPSTAGPQTSPPPTQTTSAPSQSTPPPPQATSAQPSTVVQGRFSWTIMDGMQSCGRRYSPSSYVVLVDASQFKTSMCFKKILASYNGKSIVVEAGGAFPGSPLNGLDFAAEPFKQFAPLAMGVIQNATWGWL